MGKSLKCTWCLLGNWDFKCQNNIYQEKSLIVADNSTGIFAIDTVVYMAFYTIKPCWQHEKKIKSTGLRGQYFWVIIYVTANEVADHAWKRKCYITFKF